MTVTKDTIRGYWVISDIVANHLMTRRYVGYTRREAVQQFKEECREAKGHECRPAVRQVH